MVSSDFTRKSFWKRPEGVTGILFLLAAIIGGGYAVMTGLGTILAFASTTLGLVASIGVLGLIVFMALDSKARTLVGYMYKSIMRAITGLFVQIDPIGILKSYVDELKGNLKKMNKQIIKIRGQMHKLKELILNNQKAINSNLNQANAAKKEQNKSQVILKSRKAGRLKESNMKLEDLYKKMEILYRVLMKMYENSEILKEDVADQVEIKEQEFKVIKASHSAMNNAMDIIRGDSNKKEMFEMALENIADDVSQKVGEMEQFMELSENFMQSIDLQNGIFEEEGLKMLEKWEKGGMSLILGEEKDQLLLDAESDQALDLNKGMLSKEKLQRENQYDMLFD
tara:strand:+ start:212 stop:1231 length:1020 start_codon:yes stop_codon:yes gene_type:complete